MPSAKPKDIDEYIAGFPDEIRGLLEKIRSTVRRTVPEAEESISYGIPAFNLNGKYLIYFAAHKKHIGFYPVPAGEKELDNEFASYKTSGKGTIQFPYDKPIPLDLIKKIVLFRERELIANARKRKKAVKGKRG